MYLLIILVFYKSRIILRGAKLKEKELFLGVDLGSGGCKITIIDICGRVIASSSQEYMTYRPFELYSEQNPQDWIDAFLKVLLKIKDRYSFSLQRIIGISIDASTHNAVLLDNEMKVIRPTIMWTDQRSHEEVRYLEQTWGEEIFKKSYQKVSTTWTLPQLLWIKNNEKSNFEKISKIMFVKDYLRYWLTDSWETDYIDAQGTILYDMEKQDWSEFLCGIIGLNKNILPPILKPTDIAATVTKKAAGMTGLKEGIPVIIGTSDSAIEAYASGAIEPGQCVIKLATAGNVNIITEKAFPNPLSLTYSHIIPKLWYTSVATNSGAFAMRWFRDCLINYEDNVMKTEDINFYDIFEKKILQTQSGSNGLIFHPYLNGERSPYWDPFLRASFVGFKSFHNKYHFGRAIMEGVAYSLKDCYRVVQQMGLKVKKLIIIGGGTKSMIWPQIVCDVFGKKISKPTMSDASYGSALLAAVGLGYFHNLEEAVLRCNELEKEYYPDNENKIKYNNLFKIYRKIQKKLSGIYHEINNIFN